MTWKPLPSFLTILVTITLAGSLSAEAPNEIGPFDPEEWTLQIVEKEFDPETGELHLVFENTSDSLSVTAFGVVMVLGEPDAAETIKGYATEMVYDGGIPPLGTYETTTYLGRPRTPEEPVVVHAVMDHEILSDATSQGNDVAIENYFEARTFLAIELEAALARYRNAQVDRAEKADLLAFLRREIERDVHDGPIVTTYRDKNRLTRTEINRIAAIDSIADRARQIEKYLLDGRNREEILPVFMESMEKRLEIFRSNLRSSDLENLRRAKGEPR